jgi:purine-nucleoside phosphorylase
MLEKIKQTVDFLQTKTSTSPKFGIILGTGLGNLAQEIEVEVSIPYPEIPNFPQSTVEGHGGNLIFGKLNGIDVVALQGRFHYYEGYSLQEATFPVRVFKLLGVDTLLLSNASGGTNKNFSVGDLMIIEDHINMMPDNPLRGKNIDELGPRFPDMSEPYEKDIIALAEQIAKDNNIKVQKGVYTALSGPTYETPAEYKWISIIGSDAVGMSTVPEVIVAKHMSMKCFAISVITDLGVDGKIVEISHEEVQKAAAASEPKMTLIFKELIANLASAK